MQYKAHIKPKFCLMQDLPIKFTTVAYYSIYVVQVRSPQSIQNVVLNIVLGGEEGMLVNKFCWLYIPLGVESMWSLLALEVGA